MTLRCNTPARRRLLGPIVAATTVVITLVILELVLRAVAPAPDPYEPFKHVTPVNQYIRSEFPRNSRLSTELEGGLPGVAGLRTFTTNNMGFRGSPLVTPKPSTELRIFMVGGSSTECLYLDDSRAITAVLERALNKQARTSKTIRVYNAGRSGHASDDHVSMVVHRIVHLEPDMIILFSGINDLRRSIAGHDYLHFLPNGPGERRPLLFYLATDLQLCRRVHQMMKRVAPDDREILERITLKSDYKSKMDLCRSLPTLQQRPAVDLAAYRTNLTTILGTAIAHRIQLVLMTQQTTWNSFVDENAKRFHWMRYSEGAVYSEPFMDEAMGRLNTVMREIADQWSLPIYDLAKSMPKSSDYFYDDVHFTARGAARAAKDLARVIVDSQLIEHAE